MIKDLEKEVLAVSETPTRDFGVLPKGNYTIKLLEVGEWKPRTLRNVRVITYDDKFRKVKDASGNDVIKMVDSLTIYETNLKFEVAEGDHKGRWVFSRINTHPNRPWEIPNLLSALGVPSIKLSNLDTLVGELCLASIDIDNYTKKVVDPETGIENEVPTEFNTIKRFNKLDRVDDLDI